MITFVSSIIWPLIPNYTLIVIAVCILISTYWYKISAIIIGALLGFIWASISAHAYLNWSIDDKYYNKNILIYGQVSSVVNAQSIQTNDARYGNNNNSANNTPSNLKFTLSVNQIARKKLYKNINIRVSWYQAPSSLKQGHRIKLFVKLKRPIGLANPNTFNYQKWLVSKNIVGIAYVITSPSNQILSLKKSVRQNVVDKLTQQNLDNIRWILALSVGDRALLSQSDWRLLQSTGTAHLFAISGMHLGIVFGFVKLIITLLLRALPFVSSCLRCFGLKDKTHLKQSTDLRIFINCACLVFCFFYAVLAGVEVPVLRAFLALSIYIVLSISFKHWRAASILCSLVALFFVLFPYSILSLSFWFSFGAVMLILFYLWRFPYPNDASFIVKVIHLVKMQLFLSLTTVPIVWLSFGTFASSSLLANLVMIPIVTFILVPLCLITVLVGFWDIQLSFVYQMLDKVFGLSIKLLNNIDKVTSSILKTISEFYPNFYIFLTKLDLQEYLLHPLLALVAVLAWLPSWYFKKRLILSLLALYSLHLLMIYHHKINDDSWHLYAFDVGQGSALAIESKNQYMLYDTGIASGQFSMAETVLLPFFRHKKTEKLNIFVLSHFDNDHAGGKQIIENKLAIEHLLHPDNQCYANNKQKYALANLQISILWPLHKSSGEHNNESCVIKVSDGHFSVLLTGDIEKSAEAQILSYYKDSEVLQAEVLVAPHHGSNTSSSTEFIKAVSPTHVIFTSGYQNRWNFPHPHVLQRYHDFIDEPNEFSTLSTGENGRIKLSFSAQGIEISRYRIDEFRPWYFKAPVKRAL